MAKAKKAKKKTKVTKKTKKKATAAKKSGKKTTKKSKGTKKVAKKAKAKTTRDIEQVYSAPQFAEKLRRFADSLESGEQFRIQIAGQRVLVPVSATFSVEHERSKDEEEIEFQLKWQPN